MSSYNYPHAGHEPSGLKNILVVDDEPEVLRSLCYLLGDYFNIFTAISGSETEKYFDKELDLAILDYRLPDRTGIEVLKEIKQAKPSIPVIMLTGYGDEDVAIKALRYGARDYVKKPFSAPDLIGIIERCLSVQLPKRGGSGFATAGAGLRNGICAEGRPHTQYKLQNAIKYISDNYSAKISLDAVAAKACMSKYHFSRLFKKATGTTYQGYLNECRIEKAKELLESGNLPITEIAFAVGYADMTHFARTFKKMSGFAPSQYKHHTRNQADPAKKE